MSQYAYGGQAVIEGVMMRGGQNMAVAVRRASGEIVEHCEKVVSLTERWRILNLPFIRGFILLVESLIMGVQTLAYSANQVVEEVGETISPWEMALSVMFALGAGIILFFLIPVWLAHFLTPYLPSPLYQNLGEGFLRTLIFLLYVLIISLLPDIQRVFAYHGAEHKVIHAYEAGEVLVVENVRKYSTLHPRCGTSFLLFVMLISIVVFSLCGDLSLAMRLLSRVLLLPVIAGISYEFLKFTGKYQKVWLISWLSIPGLWLQKLTTRQPDDQQLEVALYALKKVMASQAGDQ